MRYTVVALSLLLLFFDSYCFAENHIGYDIYGRPTAQKSTGSFLTTASQCEPTRPSGPGRPPDRPTPPPPVSPSNPGAPAQPNSPTGPAPAPTPGVTEGAPKTDSAPKALPPDTTLPKEKTGAEKESGKGNVQNTAPSLDLRMAELFKKKIYQEKGKDKSCTTCHGPGGDQTPLFDSNGMVQNSKQARIIQVFNGGIGGRMLRIITEAKSKMTDTEKQTLRDWAASHGGRTNF